MRGRGYRVAPHDEAELARLRGKGILDPEDDPTDLRCDSVEAELDRLTRLGASVTAEYADHLALLDPEGNEFCLSKRQ